MTWLTSHIETIRDRRIEVPGESHAARVLERARRAFTVSAPDMTGVRDDARLLTEQTTTALAKADAEMNADEATPKRYNRRARTYMEAQADDICARLARDIVNRHHVDLDTAHVLAALKLARFDLCEDIEDHAEYIQSFTQRFNGALSESEQLDIETEQCHMTNLLNAYAAVEAAHHLIEKLITASR